jgi:hypothetical protein
VLERVYNKLISELIYDCIARQVIESILIFYRPLCMKKDKTFVLRDKEHIYTLRVDYIYTSVLVSPNLCQSCPLFRSRHYNNENTFEYPLKKETKEGPKFDTDDLFSLGIITFEVELAFSRFKERLKLIRNV